MIRLNDYVEYFENLAINHEDLCHVNQPGKIAFFRIDIHELLSGFRSAIKDKGDNYVMVHQLSIQS